MASSSSTESATPFLLYGATGYSGALIARAAAADGMRPILCGRNASALQALASELDLEWRAAPIDQPDRLDEALEGVPVVLHCAGPFSSTSKPMLDACLRTGAHYLDISGEISVVEALAARSAAASARGIMAMPGVGLDVVAGDSLARHVCKRVSRPRRMSVGVQGLRLISRGTAKTIIESAGRGWARRNGRLVDVPIGTLARSFDFGWGPVECLNVSWADVSTGWYTAGIPTIDVYSEAGVPLRIMSAGNRVFGRMMAATPWQMWLKAHIDLMPPGPDEASRREAFATFVVEIEDETGRVAVSRMKTPEAYTFTAMVAPAIVRRVLGGDVEPGFQTPARVYGSDLPLSLSGVSREDLL
jgi:short subunit dehydrogenase-like uncharacterized protein